MRKAKHSSRRKVSFKDEPIDVAELAGMPNVEGMLSFLDRRPEDYARLFHSSEPAEITSPPQPISHNKTTGCGELPGSGLLPDSNLPPDSSLRPDGTLLPGSTQPPVSNLSPESPLDSSLQPDSDLPASDIPAAEDDGGIARPGSNLVPPNSKLLPDSTLMRANNSLSGRGLVTRNGRTVRIREARSVQDAHSTGEHMLLQMMWKRGTPESSETRILQAGLGELSRWTGAHKTRVRAHLRSLVEKLAIEEVQTFNAAAGREGARIYRIYFFSAILERRRRAGFTHVIRTGAVSFVDPETGAKLHAPPSGSKLLPASKLTPDRNLLSGSNLGSGASSNLYATPGSNLHCILITDQKISTATSSWPLAVRALVEATGSGDDDAVRLMANAALCNAPEATDADLAYFIRDEAPRAIRNKSLDNPIGLLIRQVPRRFIGESYRLYRQAILQQEAAANALKQQNLDEARHILDNPSLCSAEDVEWAKLVVEEDGVAKKES